jgi:hypothetical protein
MAESRLLLSGFPFISGPRHVSLGAASSLCFRARVGLAAPECAQVPFHSKTPQAIVGELMLGTLMPDIPQWCEPSWRGLIEGCLEVAPGSRMPLSEAAARLEAIVEAA